MSQRAVEHTVQRATFGAIVAVVLLYLSAVYLRTGHRREIPAVVQPDHGAVLAGGHVDLRTEPRGFGQTPFSARRPAAVVQHARVDGLTHDRLLLETRIKRSVRGHVDCHREVNQRNGTEYYNKLAQAYASAYSFVLRRNHPGFALVLANHDVGDVFLERHQWR